MKEERKNPKISVVVPMYKSAQFASELLNCLCGQTFRDTEIICVLDGPDKETEKIIREVEERDKRVRMIVREHAGAGAARNEGLSRAAGEYIIFLDADDCYSPRLLEKLYNQAEAHDADVVMCSFARENYRLKNTVRYQGVDYTRFPEGKVIDPAMVEDLYTSVNQGPINKLLRRRMIVANDLQFMNTRIANDIFFTVAALTISKRLVVIKEDLITVRRYFNEDSISSNRHRYTQDVVIVLKQIQDWLRKKGLWKTYRDTYCNLFRDALHYHAMYDRNDQYIQAMARTLSRELPWRRMCRGELINRLDFRLWKLKRRRDNLKDDIASLKNVDNTGRKQSLRMVENQIDTFRRIGETMKTKYGRDLNKRDYSLKTLSWSLQSFGFQGTWDRVRQIRGGEKMLEFNGVVCAGHLTSGRARMVFFLPAEISREQVMVENLTIAVRCDGYYPRALSGKKREVNTPLGPSMTPLQKGGEMIRKGELRRIASYVSPGAGIRIEVVFTHPLLKDGKGTPAGNNQPLSVMASGMIRMK